MKEILPTEGLITLGALAEYLAQAPSDVQQKLTENGIKVLWFGQKYERRLISLAAITKYLEKVEVKP